MYIFKAVIPWAHLRCANSQFQQSTLEKSSCTKEPLSVRQSGFWRNLNRRGMPAKSFVKDYNPDNFACPFYSQLKLARTKNGIKQKSPIDPVLRHIEKLLFLSL